MSAKAADGALKARPPNTYAARKEERTRLIETVSELSAQVQALRGNGAEMESEDTVSVDEGETMRIAVRAQQQVLWGAHTVLSDWMNAQVVNPLTSFIHLPCDQSARRRTMLSMKAQKLEVADQFLHMRNKSLDLFEPYFSENRCRNTQGDFCISRFDIIQFAGVESVRQVYDALMFSLINQEISMSEKLGDITLREEYDELWNGTGNHRLVSNGASGLQQEVNCASFVHFYEERHPGCVEPGYGVLLSDFVDVDDLHPYEPTKRVRRDVTVASLLTPYRRPKKSRDSSSAEGEELVVVLQHVAFEKLHHTEMTIGGSALRDLHQGMNRWGDVMINNIQDIMAAVTVHTRHAPSRTRKPTIPIRVDSAFDSNATSISDDTVNNLL